MLAFKNFLLGGGAVVLALAANAASPIWYGDAATAPTCQGVRATIVGTIRADDIVGTERRDVIVARGGDDVIHGRGGNDLVCGGDGADKLYGGPGDDRLFGQRDGIGSDRGGITFPTPDLVDGGVGDDYLDVGMDTRTFEQSGSHGTVSYRTASRGVTVQLATGRAWGAGADRIKVVPDMLVAGSSYADSLTGTVGDDWLSGGPGDDTIRGLAGDDYLKPEATNRKGAADHDVVYGGRGEDYVRAWKGRDVIRGGPDDDTLESYSFQPTKVYGDAGADWIMTSVTKSPGYLIDGGTGADHGSFVLPGAYRADPPVDPGSAIQVRMGRGVLVRAGSVTGHIASIEAVSLAEDLRWAYYGTAGRDEVAGGYLFGFRAVTYAGDDLVTGTKQADYIDTGAGNDSVNAFSGRDTCLNAETRHSCEIVSP